MIPGKKACGLTVMMRNNGHVVPDYGWRICAGVPIVGSGLVISHRLGTQPALRPYTHKQRIHQA